MPLTRLSISQLRNIHHADVQPHSSLNLLFGDNGAGKTSFLEAVNLLSQGKSFRHHRPKPLINHDSDSFSVFGEIVGQTVGLSDTLGVSKNRAGETKIRINGEPVYSSARLAEKLPVLSLSAQSFELIEGPPKPRRQLLDWLTFHVEPQFLVAWKEFQHCLKQRNSLLRRGKIRARELAAWDPQLTELAEKIHAFRQGAFEQYCRALSALGTLLPGLGETTIDYRKGWLTELRYEDALKGQQFADIERGYTQSGPHRADLTIKVDGRAAADVVSRGQQKMLVSALIITLGMAFSQVRGKRCVFLVDDLPSELDTQHRRQVGTWLSGLNAQLFVTAVDRDPLISMWPSGFAHEGVLFHVEQGTLCAAE